MASRTYSDLAAFTAAVAKFGTKIGDLADMKQAGKDNPAYQIAEGAGEMFLLTAQTVSPYDTGTLFRAHRRSKTTLVIGGGKTKATTIIDIDPDPSIINPKYGGFPGDYGPKYHRNVRAWFGEAIDIIAPAFAALMDDEVRMFFSGIWR